jgi:hypothetical protein
MVRRRALRVAAGFAESKVHQQGWSVLLVQGLTIVPPRNVPTAFACVAQALALPCQRRRLSTPARTMLSASPAAMRRMVAVAAAGAAAGGPQPPAAAAARAAVASRPAARPRAQRPPSRPPRQAATAGKLRASRTMPCGTRRRRRCQRASSLRKYHRQLGCLFLASHPQALQPAPPPPCTPCRREIGVSAPATAAAGALHRSPCILVCRYCAHKCKCTRRRAARLQSRRPQISRAATQMRACRGPARGHAPRPPCPGGSTGGTSARRRRRWGGASARPRPLSSTRSRPQPESDGLGGLDGLLLVGGSAQRLGLWPPLCWTELRAGGGEARV